MSTQGMFSIDALLSPSRRAECETGFHHFLPSTWQVPATHSRYNSNRVTDFQTHGGKLEVMFTLYQCVYIYIYIYIYIPSILLSDSACFVQG